MTIIDSNSHHCHTFVLFTGAIVTSIRNPTLGSRTTLVELSEAGRPKANYGPGMQVKMRLPARDLHGNNQGIIIPGTVYVRSWRTLGYTLPP